MFKNVPSFSRSNLGLSVLEDSVHSLKLFRVRILLAPKGINEITEEHDEKKTKLSNDDFSVVVFEIQEEDINFDTKKTTTRREGEVNRSFWL